MPQQSEVKAVFNYQPVTREEFNRLASQVAEIDWVKTRIGLSVKQRVIAPEGDILTRLDTLEQQLLLHRATSDVSERLAALESAQVPNAVSRAKVDKAQLDLVNALSERLAAVEQQVVRMQLLYGGKFNTPEGFYGEGIAKMLEQPPQAPPPAAPDVREPRISTTIGSVIEVDGRGNVLRREGFEKQPAAPAKRITPEQVEALLGGILEYEGEMDIINELNDADRGAIFGRLAARLNDFFGGK